MYYNGIRIAAAEGTAVQAAADGLVIFSAHLKDYGETIIIQHEDQYATVYTHLGIRTVRGETRVKKGDRIAFLGKAESGRKPISISRSVTRTRREIPFLSSLTEKSASFGRVGGKASIRCRTNPKSY